MAETPNYGFDVVDPNDPTRLVLQWVQATFGPDSTSTIMRLDTILQELSQKEGFKVVESENEPTDLNEGDEWDKLL